MNELIIVEIECQKDDAELFTEIFFNAGATGSSELLYQDGISDNLNIDTTLIQFTFPSNFPVRPVISCLEGLFFDAPISYRLIEANEIEFIDFEAMSLSKSLVMVPHWQEAPPGEQEPLWLNPGQGFGTGYHPTTRMCVEALEALELSGKVVLDAGTGSGILAIAAALLGARHVIGFDIESQAVEAAEKNADLNKLNKDTLIFELAGLEFQALVQPDIFVANILPAIFLQNKEHMLRHLKCQSIVLSGVAKGREEELEQWFREIELSYTRSELEGWYMYTSSGLTH